MRGVLSTFRGEVARSKSPDSAGLSVYIVELDTRKHKLARLAAEKKHEVVLEEVVDRSFELYRCGAKLSGGIGPGRLVVLNPVVP